MISDEVRTFLSAQATPELGAVLGRESRVVGEPRRDASRLALAGRTVRVVPAMLRQAMSELVSDRGCKLAFVVHEARESCIDGEDATRKHVQRELILVQHDHSPTLRFIRCSEQEPIE